MSIPEPSFWKYLIFNNDGIIGIKDDAPPKEKKAYEAYLKEMEQMEKEGIK